MQHLGRLHVAELNLPLGLLVRLMGHADGQPDSEDLVGINLANPQ
jgi:hypothetical protein